MKECFMKLVGEVSYFKKSQGFGFGFIEVKTKIVGAGYSISRYYLAQKEIEFSIPEEVCIGNWVRFNPGPCGSKPGNYQRALNIEVYENREQVDNAVLIEQVRLEAEAAAINEVKTLIAAEDNRQSIVLPLLADDAEVR
jgi:hypothetical protein